MMSSPAGVHRLQFLTRVAGKQARHLASTSERLFSAPFTPERAAALDDTPDLAERIDAFVSRLGLIPSADQSTEVRSLRNQMIPEYVEDPPAPSPMVCRSGC